MLAAPTEPYVIFLHRGAGEDGQKLYFYLLVAESQLEQYTPLLESGTATLREYEKAGMVLASGFGEPEPHVVALMKQLYGFEESSEGQGGL